MTAATGGRDNTRLSGNPMLTPVCLLDCRPDGLESARRARASWGAWLTLRPGAGIGAVRVELQAEQRAVTDGCGRGLRLRGRAGKVRHVLVATLRGSNLRRPGTVTVGAAGEVAVDLE